MQHLKSCLLWQLKLTEFCVNLWCFFFNCLFPLNVQSEIQLLSRVFWYSWLVCLLGFSLRNTLFCKVGNPIADGIVFDLHLGVAWCVRRLKSLKRFWPYLMVFSASQMVSEWSAWVIIVFDVCLFFISNFMKSSLLYAAIWFMHVCKIWDNDLTESDRVSGLIISLYNFKQPLDISSPQIERKRSKEYLVIILAVKKALSDFLASSSSLKKANTSWGSRLKT